MDKDNIFDVQIKGKHCYFSETITNPRQLFHCLSFIQKNIYEWYRMREAILDQIFPTYDMELSSFQKIFSPNTETSIYIALSNFFDDLQSPTIGSQGPTDLLAEVFRLAELGQITKEEFEEGDW